MRERDHDLLTWVQGRADRVAQGARDQLAGIEAGLREGFQKLQEQTKLQKEKKPKKKLEDLRQEYLQDVHEKKVDPGKWEKKFGFKPNGLMFDWTFHAPDWVVELNRKKRKRGQGEAGLDAIVEPPPIVEYDPVRARYKLRRITQREALEYLRGCFAKEDALKHISDCMEMYWPEEE
jgi:hypothetical protein